MRLSVMQDDRFPFSLTRVLLRICTAQSGWFFAPVSVTLLFMLTTPADATVILAGDPNTIEMNAFPFGGKAFAEPGTRYQQVYNASLFPKSFTIDKISFFGHSGPFQPDRTFIMRLSTTSKAVNGLDTVSLANNVGPDDTLFASMSPNGTIPDKFTFDGTDFLYDPTKGNLLVEILIPGGSVNYHLYDGYAKAHNGTFGNISSRAHDFDSGFESFGLVTEFEGANVPEPTALAIWSALGGLGMIAARRRRKTA
ncbi:MAG: hypothetical protein GXX96_04270 [Planctomycetaceae bacterium]|nr:hypothetical protein [Planctomycetaceae bacterium]